MVANINQYILGDYEAFFPQNYGIKLLAYGSHSYLKVSIIFLVNLLSFINTDVLLLLWISPNFIIFGRRV